MLSAKTLLQVTVSGLYHDMVQIPENGGLN